MKTDNGSKEFVWDKGNIDKNWDKHGVENKEKRLYEINVPYQALIKGYIKKCLLGS